MGMQGFDRRIRCLCRHVELPSRTTGTNVRANVVSRVKSAIASAFATPALASAVA